MSHYDTLNVARDATQDEIKSAFRRAARAAHPDREGGDTEQMARVNRAYQVLGDPAARAQYDQTGDDPIKPNDPVVTTLVELFEMAIESCDGDVIEFCDRKITSALRELDNRQESANKSIRKLTKKRDRVMSKGDGENLYTSLIDRKLQVEQDLLQQVAEARKTMNGARDRLRGYESRYVPDPISSTGMEQQMKASQLDEMIAEMQRGIFGADFGRRSGRFF